MMMIYFLKIIIVMIIIFNSHPFPPYFISHFSLASVFCALTLTCFELSPALFLPPSFLSSDLLFHSLLQLRPAFAFLCSALVRFLEFFSVSPCHQLEVCRWFTHTHKREKCLLILADFIVFFCAHLLCATQL